MASYSFLPLGLAIAALLHLLTQVTAHLELSVDEPAHHQLQIKRDSEALSNCLKSPAMQEHNDRMLEYRNETLHKLRKARGIDSTISKPFQRPTSLPCSDNRQTSPGAAMRTGTGTLVSTTKRNQDNHKTPRTYSTSVGATYPTNTRVVPLCRILFTARSGKSVSPCARTSVLASVVSTCVWLCRSSISRTASPCKVRK